MGSNLHFLTNSLLAVVCAVMGASFLSIHMPKKDGLRSYQISLRVLAIAYFAMSLIALTVIFFNLSDNSSEYISFIITFISSIQALLFSFTLITLINPTFVKIKNVFFHSLPIAIFLLLYIIFNALFGDPVVTSLNQFFQNISHPTLILRLFFLGFYVFQLIYYTDLFLKEAQRYDSELLNYFSDVVQLRLKWVRVAFFAALFVGFTALISCFFPKKDDWIFNILYSFFYFLYAQEYIKYNKVYNIVEPVIQLVPEEDGTVMIKARVKADWDFYKHQIESQHYYREAGINIEDLAYRLKIGRTTLSNLINREEGVNFNTWINLLRIEDAKQLLLENPDYTIATISEMVGYTEQANFSRQFKQITGESPLLWRKKVIAS